MCLLTSHLLYDAINRPFLFRMLHLTCGSTCYGLNGCGSVAVKTLLGLLGICHWSHFWFVETWGVTHPATSMEFVAGKLGHIN